MLDDADVMVLLGNEESSVLVADEDTLALLENDDLALEVLLDDNESVLLADEGKVPRLLELEMASVLLDDGDTDDEEELGPMLLDGDAEGILLGAATVLELSLEKLELVEAILDEIVVPVLLTEDNETSVLLDDRLLTELLDTALLLELESVELGGGGSVLESVRHGGPVTNVLVKVAVTKSVVVCTTSAFRLPSHRIILTVLIDVTEAVVSPNSDLHKHALL
ncbi:hypothetical protein DE146DRAFT_657169 [Phaeosphaeria sp. MPI-PUGE-AT-0046c]|nr:hypothetical protein DE146DRAFT_657169 [Phaeosphaeria sp. MPI-PUGE-AT-0046c]